MKILVYGINFAPELTGIGKYTGEMARWLAHAGHEVRAIAAPPYYPAWQVGEGHSARRYRTEMWEGVRVTRCPLWVPQQPGGLKRLLHLGSFALGSLPALLAQWRWKPDVVWVVEPPLMCAPAAVAFASLRGARSWLHIQDYEVDAAFDLGLIQGAVLRRWVERAERWLMRRFDRVSTISGRMVERARHKGVEAQRIVHFPNWVDIGGVAPLAAPSPYRAELGLAPDAVVALYTGNMGNKQGLEILADVARLVRDDPRIQFVFGGNGSGRADLQARCAGLNHVRFLDLQPLERLSDWLGLADVHLLPQRADAADLVMPSKLTGMLASGRAVLATAHADTELCRVVEQDAACGVVVPPENPIAMAEALRALAADPARRATLGTLGRRYAEAELGQDAILRRFETQLQDLLLDGSVVQDRPAPL
ncbi:glycosyltransferase WbuB [Hydrogenophaga sp. BPS33]|uniref:glycosyltransferase WbuB n=1 Tax=Hydrogenophaga sp. BPS33 TaxID=2651974 RepID=UPI0013202D93|nr:glycosyltransferase WbuB [Hydrogenophaga sp. BPS33]QHE88548.1 glycosyltransferase WbuB [Hydrogenophaga sp. BPS33]